MGRRSRTSSSSEDRRHDPWLGGLHQLGGRPEDAGAVDRLITEAARDPATGTGKPDRLRGGLSGCWSRRIDQGHRLVCTVQGDDLVVLQVRYHY